MKINKVEDSLGGVETFDQWKEKASELESSVSEVEGKFKPEKDIKKDYGQIQAVLSNIQVRDSTPKDVFRKLQRISIYKFNLCVSLLGMRERD